MKLSGKLVKVKQAQVEYVVAFDYLGLEENAEPWRFYLSGSPLLFVYTARREQSRRFTSQAAAHGALQSEATAAAWLARNRYMGRIITAPRVMLVRTRQVFNLLRSLYDVPEKKL